MDTVDLPLVYLGTTPADAFACLRAADRAALITGEDDTRFRCLSLKHVLFGIREGLATLAAVPDPLPVHVFGRDEIHARGLDLLRPWLSADAFEQALDADGSPLGLIAIAHATSTAFVVTRHEGIAGDMSRRPITCVCADHPDHLWEPHEVSSGRCPLDDGIVTCG